MARALLLPDSKRLRNIISQKLDKKIIIPQAADMFEYLAMVGYKGEIIVELKELSDKCKDATIEIINAYKDKLNFAVQSYDVDKVITIGEKTGIKTGVLKDVFKMNQKKNIDPDFIKNMPFDFYSLIWPVINEETLASIVENNKELYAWTIDSSVHLWMILNGLERFYDKYSILPKSTNLITNIPIVLNEYLNQDGQNIPLGKSINEKYQKLFGENERKHKL
jgi:hypothetical protein